VGTATATDRHTVSDRAPACSAGAIVFAMRVAIMRGERTTAA
jgi:hypothetical protein